MVFGTSGVPSPGRPWTSHVSRLTDAGAVATLVGGGPGPPAMESMMRMRPRIPTPASGRALATAALALALLLAACGGGVETSADGADAASVTAGDANDAASDVGSNDDVGGDAATDATDAGVALAYPTDGKALGLLLQARAGALASTSKPWPGPDAIWPGYGLHKVPILLAILDSKLKPIRGYLLGGPTTPEGAQLVDPATLPVASSEPVLRHDAGVAKIGAAEEIIIDHDLGGVSVLVVTWSPARDSDPVRWIRRLGQGYMLRLREIEAKWSAVQACGQVRYPRDLDAIALLFLECAVLAEAYAAKDAAAASTFLQEWAAIRAAAIDKTAAVGARIRHYDNQFGSEQFTAGRLAVAAGLHDHAALDADYLARLAAPAAVTVTAFDDEMADNGTLGAVSMEIASRLGWDIEPTLRTADVVYALVAAKLGATTPQMVEAAKARHDWAGFLARAAAVMALPIDD